jgi:hypothetical protein
MNVHLFRQSQKVWRAAMIKIFSRSATPTAKEPAYVFCADIVKAL